MEYRRLCVRDQILMINKLQYMTVKKIVQPLCLKNRSHRSKHILKKRSFTNRIYETVWVPREYRMLSRKNIQPSPANGAGHTYFPPQNIPPVRDRVWSTVIINTKPSFKKPQGQQAFVNTPVVIHFVTLSLPTCWKTLKISAPSGNCPVTKMSEQL